MKKREKLEAAVVKAKAMWRRLVGSPEATAADRRKALAAWKKAREERDQALMLWKRELADRRKANADRRRMHAHADWLKTHGDQRKAARRSHAAGKPADH